MNKVEYTKIGLQRGLPCRCPILEKCMRRAKTITFFSDEELPIDFINNCLPLSGEEPTCSKSNDVFYFHNVCPEINLFDDQHAPPFAQGTACISGSHIDRTTKLSEFRHYSECPEYCANCNKL